MDPFSKPKKKKPMTAKDRKREERVVKDLDEINKETSPIKRHEKMKEKRLVKTLIVKLKLTLIEL